MIEFRAKKQNDGIKIVKKVDKKCKKISTEEIKEDAKLRSKDENFLKKLLNFFKKDKQFTEIIINGILSEKRVAVLQDGILKNIEIESKKTQHMVGSVFKGRIQNLEPGLKAAFVDIGQVKNAFLHYWDILPLVNGEGLNEEDSDEGIEVIHRNTNVTKPKVGLQDIPNLFPIGSELVVQITKSQIGTKGPRTTTNISLAGRYLVLTPYSNQCGISRKIEDQKERIRLKKILKKLTLPLGMGVIFRTASSEGTLKQFIRDLQFLLDTWTKIQQKVDSSKNVQLVYHEPNLIERTVRDFLTDDIDRIIVDNQEDYDCIIENLERIAPNLQSKIVFFKEPIPVFDRFNIETQIDQTFSSRVPLPSGGEIVIQETEALTSIDVNTSSHRSMDNEGTHFIFQANIEAAREVARQVRLRNIGGLIIVDFIDMKHSKDRKMLHQFLQEEFLNDKAKTHVLPISSLGIMQISRQRHKESFLSQLYDDCPYCNGEGVVKSMNNLSLRLQREIISQVLYALKNNTVSLDKLEIKLHPNLLKFIKNQCNNEFLDIENKFNLQLTFVEEDNFHIETFKVAKM